MSELPASGTLTFLFTDIEGSTRLLRELGEEYTDVLAVHRDIVAGAAADAGGRLFGTEGDALALVFADARSALVAAARAQRELAGRHWPADRVLRVRMGIHTGEARRLGDDYVGLALHETARITAAGHGGQVLLSEATRALVGEALPEGTRLRDLGRHRLKDLPQPVPIFGLEIEGLPAEFPPLRTLDVVGARLPAQLTTFVGRDEVERGLRLLETSRLLTLTGPGGTGKTRLSLQIAAEAASRFPDGTFFVALDAITDADLVSSEIAATLSLPSGSEDPLDRVLGHLRERSALLVLDNMEQVVAAGPDVARIVRECSRVAVVVTSRIPLRIYGEQEFPVPALSLPAAHASPTAAGIATSEAVRLFVERAMAARPDFSLTDRNAPAVASIVIRLDGLPLAIELAAARLRVLTVEALQARLGDRLGVLTGGARDLPGRQQTLRGAIAWSHELLDPPDRKLFARFSVLAGAGAYPQIESACGPASELGRDVLEGLESLATQSLLRPMEADGEPRVGMLATIREFAQERLRDEPDESLVHRRHAEAYLALAEEAAPHLLGPEGGSWNDRLELEHDNLRAALDWAVGADESGIAVRMVAALWRFWQVRGHLIEADERIHRALDLPSAAGQPPEVLSRAHAAAGGVAYWRNDLASTHRHYAEALSLARLTTDQGLLAESLYNAGFAAEPDATFSAERLRAGMPLFEESLELYRRLGDRAGVASTLWALSMGAAADGDFPRARQLVRESLELARELGDPFRIGWAAHNVGLGELASPTPGAAAPYFVESLRIFSEARDQTGIVLLLLDIGFMLQALDDPRGWLLSGAADRLRTETGVELAGQEADFTWLLTGATADGRPGPSSWTPRFTPETKAEEERFEEGRRLPLDEAVSLALAWAEEVSTGSDPGAPS